MTSNNTTCNDSSPEGRKMRYINWGKHRRSLRRYKTMVTKHTRALTWDTGENFTTISYGFKYFIQNVGI